MSLQIDAKFNDSHTLALEKFPLEQSVWSTDEDLSAIAEHAVPGNALAGRSGSHSAAGRARPAGQMQSSSEGSIS
jgi:hypothetical protein